MRLCTLWRIPIYVHATFPLIFVIDLINALRFSDFFIWMILFVILDGILFFSVLLHELGHCAATRMVGGDVDSILLWPLGGLAYVGHAGGPKKEILISLAGPITHIPQILIWGFVLVATYGFHNIGYWYAPIQDNENFSRNVIEGAFFQQLLLIILNLFVPAYPLDGGRVYANALIQCYDMKKTAQILVFTSVPIGIGLAVFGGVMSWMITCLVGVYILYQAWVLWNSMDSLDRHPLFARSGGGGGHMPLHDQPESPPASL